MPPLMPAAPEIFLAVASMALLMLGVFSGPKSARMVSWLSVIALLVCGAILSSVVDGRTTTFGGQFVVDDFAHYMKWLVLIGSAFAIVMSMRFNEQAGIDRFEFPVLIVFATLGMLMMVSANDLISLYVGLELQSLSLYVVASFRRDSRRSSEAGLKYFVLGALSSGMLLYGASLVYGFAGTTSFDGLVTLFRGLGGEGLGSDSSSGWFSLFRVLPSRSRRFPSICGRPDVYQGAPTPVTAFFAVAPKVAAIALFIRVLVGPFGVMIGDWQQVIILISVGSMALGALAAISQTNIKRLMAYSSIGHIGYALIGLAAGSEAGVTGILVYMAIYLAMNVGTFCCILAMRRTGRAVEGIEDLAGLARTRPMMALALAVMMFSMAGIPPLAGFLGKFYIFIAAIDAGLVTLAVICVLTSVVGAFYYLRIVKIMYFDDPIDALDGNMPGELRTVLFVSTVFVLLFFLQPGLIVDSASAAAQTLMGG